MPEEEWRDIPGWEGLYQASSIGRIRSVDRRVKRPVSGDMNLTGKIIGQCPWRGYFRVLLFKGSKRTNLPVHKLVALTFLGDPNGLHVCHNDGDSTNNNVTNLRYDTHSGNISDAVKHGTHNQARKTHCPAGHEYAGYNLFITKDGRRACRECKRLHCARYRREKKQRMSGE